MPNHLAGSTSPYLLQHAHNPVDWYPWGPEALEKARREDKPIFLSIGYAACHWCHVMAHESFEDPATAAYLNQHFVSIKVDREERPDLDSIYMSAVVALTGQGGWPMSVFLDHDLRPFYGGTYFPPVPRYNMPAFKSLLDGLASAWRDQRDAVASVGAQIAEQLRQPNLPTAAAGAFTPAHLKLAADELIARYDWTGGGWGPSPKFPQPMAIEFLLRRHAAGDAEALKPALHALNAMARGGMYDVVGGGFARYSTDTRWLVPHFEKMLYDNALLTRAYLHAWQITAAPSYRRVVEHTLDFILREMTAPGGGFYSSLDADSEGVEGKFYVWTLDEIRAVLGDDAPLFEVAYDVRDHGNWEGKAVLQRALEDDDLAELYHLSVETIAERLGSCLSLLLEVRAQRVRPGTDDKVLTAWNGWMLAAFAEAARSLDRPDYLAAAQRNAHFLLTSLRPSGSLSRAWRDSRAGSQVFLEDYAALILGLLALYQADFDPRWYSEAAALAAEMVAQFSDPAGGFFDTPAQAETLLTRPKDLQDNATPCGNALAAEALLMLAAFGENEDWRSLAEQTLSQVAGTAERYPTAFGRWLAAADFSLSRVRQAAVIGDLADEGTRALLDVLRAGYRPNLVTAASRLPLPDGSPALLADRPLVDGKPTVYLCEGFVCRAPLTEQKALRKELSKA